MGEHSASRSVHLARERAGPGRHQLTVRLPTPGCLRGAGPCPVLLEPESAYTRAHQRRRAQRAGSSIASAAGAARGTAQCRLNRCRAATSAPTPRCTPSPPRIRPPVRTRKGGGPPRSISGIRSEGMRRARMSGSRQATAPAAFQHQARPDQCTHPILPLAGLPTRNSRAGVPSSRRTMRVRSLREAASPPPCPSTQHPAARAPLQPA